MNYTIVVDDDKVKLEKRVTEMIEAGWELQGGVSVSVSESDDYKYIYFAQALIKRRGGVIRA